MEKFTFIDLFSGIGGFHQALKELNGACVFACEIDKFARKTYLANHDMKGIPFAEDITKIDIKSIPDHDILCAGFPCQPFSQAGFKKGFKETRGTLFFDIVSILEEKKPKAFFLENVRHLLRHDSGKTFSIIEETIKRLGYSFHYKIVKASDHGVPQNRPRLFMVGFKDNKKDFRFPDSVPLEKSMSDILGGLCSKNIGFTLRVGGKGSKIDDRRNWDSYLVDGKVEELPGRMVLKCKDSLLILNFQYLIAKR